MKVNIICKMLRNFTKTFIKLNMILMIREFILQAISSVPNWTYLTDFIINNINNTFWITINIFTNIFNSHHDSTYYRISLYFTIFLHVTLFHYISLHYFTIFHFNIIRIMMIIVYSLYDTWLHYDKPLMHFSIGYCCTMLSNGFNLFITEVTVPVSLHVISFSHSHLVILI